MNRILKATFYNSLSFSMGLGAFILVAAVIFASNEIFFSEFTMFGILILAVITGAALKLFSQTKILKEFGMTLVAVPFVIVIATLLGLNELIYIY